MSKGKCMLSMDKHVTKFLATIDTDKRFSASEVSNYVCGCDRRLNCMCSTAGALLHRRDDVIRYPNGKWQKRGL